MSAGSMSGVNWMRWNFAWIAAASVRSDSVFASPGTPSSKKVAVGEQADEQPVEQIVLPDNHASDFLLKRAHPARCALDRFRNGLDAGVLSGDGNGWLAFRRAPNGAIFRFIRSGDGGG